jgi:hypothetical protein
MYLSFPRANLIIYAKCMMPPKLSKGARKTVVAFDRGCCLKSAGPGNLGCAKKWSDAEEPQLWRVKTNPTTTTTGYGFLSILIVRTTFCILLMFAIWKRRSTGIPDSYKPGECAMRNGMCRVCDASQNRPCVLVSVHVTELQI